MTPTRALHLARCKLAGWLERLQDRLDPLEAMPSGPLDPVPSLFERPVPYWPVTDDAPASTEQPAVWTDPIDSTGWGRFQTTEPGAVEIYDDYTPFVPPPWAVGLYDQDRSTHLPPDCSIFDQRYGKWAPWHGGVNREDDAR